MNSPSQTAVDAYALRVTARLTHATQAVRRAETATVLVGAGGAAVLGRGGDEGNWWRALVSAVPVAALLVGLFFVNMAQDQTVAAEIAEVDAALLTDDLPPSAYADPGFLQFIKTSSPGQ
jgi:hypothetical protein